MSGKFAVFLLGCAATGALTFYFVKSDADKRIAGMQQALDNLTYASKREEQNHRKELAEMQARLSGPPKAKPADNWPPKGTRISRITGEGLLLETATGLTMVTWSEVPEELRHSYELQAKEAIASEADGARATVTFEQRVEQSLRDDAAEKARVEAQWKKERDAKAANAQVGSAWMIKGRIIQKTRDGLLVQSIGGHTGERRTLNTAIVNPKETRVTLVGGMPIYEGLCLLKNHPDEAGFADGDQVNIQASDSGSYQYLPVGGAGRTIKQFTAH